MYNKIMYYTMATYTTYTLYNNFCGIVIETFLIYECLSFEFTRLLCLRHSLHSYINYLHLSIINHLNKT